MCSHIASMNSIGINSSLEKHKAKDIWSEIMTSLNIIFVARSEDENAPKWSLQIDAGSAHQTQIVIKY